jgi:hypothetical protein
MLEVQHKVVGKNMKGEASESKAQSMGVLIEAIALQRFVVEREQLTLCNKVRLIHPPILHIIGFVGFIVPSIVGGTMAFRTSILV